MTKAELGKLVGEWAKVQADAEKAREAAAGAGQKAQAFAKKLYDVFGTRPFVVKSLDGRKYRCIHRAPRTSKNGKAIAESYTVIPIAENETDLVF